jgi:hypothetical protein
LILIAARDIILKSRKQSIWIELVYDFSGKCSLKSDKDSGGHLIGGIGFFVLFLQSFEEGDLFLLDLGFCVFVILESFFAFFLLNGEFFCFKEFFDPFNKLFFMLFECFLEFLVVLIGFKIVFIEVKWDSDVNFGDSEFAKFIRDIDLR